MTVTQIYPCSTKALCLRDLVFMMYIRADGSANKINVVTREKSKNKSYSLRGSTGSLSIPTNLLFPKDSACLRYNFPLPFKRQRSFDVSFISYYPQISTENIQRHPNHGLYEYCIN